MMEQVLERYEPVIGLEVHTHLLTRSFRWLRILIISKLWCIGRQQCGLLG